MNLIDFIVEFSHIKHRNKSLITIIKEFHMYVSTVINLLHDCPIEEIVGIARKVNLTDI